jgi:hypothetical protein
MTSQAPKPVPSSLRSVLPSAALIALLVLWTGGSAWLRPTQRALGSAWSEAPGHLWGLWTTAAGLWEHGPLLRAAPGLGFPDGFTAHLVDPVNLLLFLPGYWLGGGGVGGAVLGWNLLHVGAVVVGGLGCARLARVLLGRDEEAPWSAALLVAAFCGGAFLLSHPHMGRSEYLPAVLMPWHLALLLPWLRGDGGRWSGLGAGLCLGAVALGGSYLAVFALLLELPLAAVLLWSAGARWRRSLARLALVAAVALLVAAPMLAALLLHPPPGAAPLLHATPRIMPESDLHTVAAMFRLGRLPRLEPLLDQPPYPGIAVLLLGALGAIRHPRQALPWLLLGLWLLLLSLGVGIAIQRGGRPGMISLPAGWLTALAPPLANIKTWSRVGVLFPLPLGIAAMFGAHALSQRLAGWRRGALGLLLVLTVVADQASWPRRCGMERPLFEPTIPAGAAAAFAMLPPGAIIQLPLEVSVGKGVKLQAARSHLWQAQHGRSITSTPAVVSDSALRWSTLARLAVNRQFAEAGAEPRGGALPGATGPLDQRWLDCAHADLDALRERGVVGLVLLEGQPASGGLLALLEQVLGPPRRHDQVAVWDISAAVEAASDGCALPPVPGKVRMMLSADGGSPPPRPPPEAIGPAPSRGAGAR